MQKRVFQILADNNAGVLSRITGLFSRRGYNIDSITAGITADPRYSRITIVTSGDEDILDQIENQVEKLVDVRDVRELKPDKSVYRELCLIKVHSTPEKRQHIISIADIFRANIVDVNVDSLIVELTGNQTKIEAFMGLLRDYEILEVARTGIAGLSRGSEELVCLD